MKKNKSPRNAKPMTRKSLKSTKGGAWYAKFDGVDGSSAQPRPTETLSLNFTKIT